MAAREMNKFDTENTSLNVVPVIIEGRELVVDTGLHDFVVLRQLDLTRTLQVLGISGNESSSGNISDVASLSLIEGAHLFRKR